MILADLYKCVGHSVLLHMAFEAVARDIVNRMIVCHVDGLASIESTDAYHALLSGFSRELSRGVEDKKQIRAAVLRYYDELSRRSARDLDSVQTIGFFSRVLQEAFKIPFRLDFYDVRKQAEGIVGFLYQDALLGGNYGMNYMRGIFFDLQQNDVSGIDIREAILDDFSEVYPKTRVAPRANDIARMNAMFEEFFGMVLDLEITDEMDEDRDQYMKKDQMMRMGESDSASHPVAGPGLKSLAEIDTRLRSLIKTFNA